MFKQIDRPKSYTYSLLLRSILVCSGLLSVVLLGPTANSFAATAGQYSAIPPFLRTEVPPNVMFMLDNSGSMKNTVYYTGNWRTTVTTNFNPVRSGGYYGIFEAEKNYEYDDTIPIHPHAYDGSANAPYNVTVDTSDPSLKGAFIESSCTPGGGANCWNGSFLNWITTRRIDAARKVMIGGKTESRVGYDYDGDGSDEWKIIGNNEPDDATPKKSYSSSSSYSPVPDGTKISLYSPADAGKAKSSYDPHAKISYKKQKIVNSDGDVIGETGFIHNLTASNGPNTWHKVVLTKTNYTKPVIIAVPLEVTDDTTGGSPIVTRVTAVKAGSFTIRAEEWEHAATAAAHDGVLDRPVDVSYIVLEEGTHTLPGGQKIQAKKVNTNKTGGSWLNNVSYNIGSRPVILTTVVTNHGVDTVTARIKDLTHSWGTSNFDLQLAEEEKNGTHTTETVAILVLEQGRYNVGDLVFDVSTKTGVDYDTVNEFHTINWSSALPAGNIHFLAAMQTTNNTDTSVLLYKNLSNTSVEIKVAEETSKDNEVTHPSETVGYIAIGGAVDKSLNVAVIVDKEPSGLLHDIKDKVRLGISFYNYGYDKNIYWDASDGGTLRLNIPKNPFIQGDSNASGYRANPLETYIGCDINDIVDAIEHYPQVWGTTPLAENYYEVIRYFRQLAPHYPAVEGASYLVNNTWDPYYYIDPNGDGDHSDAGLIDCAQSYVLLFTDGGSYADNNIYPFDDFVNDYDGDKNKRDCGRHDDSSGVTICNNNLDDLAYWAYHNKASNTDRDLRSSMNGNQNIITYTVGFGRDTVPQNLKDTAKQGGGIAYAAEDGRELKEQLSNAFTDILSRSSGTAASVISNTRSGEGAIYQSVFFPSMVDSSDKVTWVGQVHALLVDAYGNMREDTNDNDKLDLANDYFVVFNEDGTAARYEDGDGNQKLQTDTATCPTSTKPPAAAVCYDKLIDTINLEDLNYLWNTSNWLNEISDDDAEDQRSTYISATDERYIFTWVDDDNDNVVDSTEVIDFTCSSTPSATDLTDADEIYPYLHLYPSFADRPAAISSLPKADLISFLQIQTKRQINYIRGSDCVDSSDAEDCNTQDLTIGGTPVPNTAMRSRQYDYDGDGTLETWRLGDIVYSTPTMVGPPAENLHLLYRDLTYAPFVAKYKKRRQVVYAGANDGMVHAFNAGFYNPLVKQFCTSSDMTKCQDITEPKLGAELWAYVPFNLLPHLYWLTQPTYNESKHVYYIDLKPRIFDAKIFTEEGACSDITDTACVHPNGWGTVMVVGMNFGGGSIIADMDKTDGNAPVATDPTMKSAFMIFDITNPEEKPTLMAELAIPKMGFSTSYPTVVAMRDSNNDGIYSSAENKWYLAFGSGPADSNGNPGTVSSATGNYNDEILDDVKSLQPGQFYLLDLLELATNNALYTLNSSGVSTAGLTSYSTYDTNTFISAPVTADFDLDYNADALYFGTVSGKTKPWGGKLRRIVIDYLTKPIQQAAHSVLMDVAKPITAAPAIGQDDDGRHWMFFGTGRYFNAGDKSDTNQQSFYGLKEPLDSNSVKDWSTLTTSDIIDVSSFEVYSDHSVDGGATDNNWAGLLTDQSVKDGWYLDFSTGTGEKNLGQAALIGGLLSFTTFIPESDICSAGGESFLWALYYQTGTAHYSGVLGTETVSGKEQTIKEISLGQGLSTSPNIHIGRESGTAVFVQSSTGEITKIEQDNPLSTKSGMQSWKLQE